MKVCKRLLIIIPLVILSFGLISTSASGAAPVKKKADSPMVKKCKEHLAKRLKLEAQNIKVINIQPVIWPDAALGMPEAGKVYAQVMTPGSRVVLEAGNSQYLYTTSSKTFKYGGPIYIWSYSMLYLKPVQNEPDLNGDLYQCSLLGTNSTRVVSSVSEYYPQDKGVIIAKRRTSRSSHELLYVKADKAAGTKTLYSAFDFGNAAINGGQDRWAAFVRPALGIDWNITAARIGEDSTKAKILPLPDGVKPGLIVWSGETVMILVDKGNGKAGYEITPNADTPQWKEIAAHTFPGLPSFMLNKSETLEIRQNEVNGKPGVEIALVWFTGDRNVKAQIEGITLRGYDLLGSSYAFIWGEKGSEPVVYTVDIATGEVIPAAGGISRDLKPFLYPPINNPLMLKTTK